MSGHVPTLSLGRVEVNYDEWVSPFAERTLRQLHDFSTRYRLYASVGLPIEPTLRAHASVNDYMFPRARADRLYATGSMMVYFFIFDHLYDVDALPTSNLVGVRRRLADAILGAIGGARPDRDHLERAAVEAVGRFADEDPRWLAGLSTQLTRYVQATVQGKRTAKERPSTSLEEYLEIRQHDSGGLWSADLIEYANRQFLSPRQRAHPDVVRARQQCMWACSLLNDLFSWAKERESEDAPFNALHFVMGSQGLSELDAAHFVCTTLHGILERFEGRLDAPVFHEDDAVASYAQGLREFVSGVWYWHQSSGLYVHPRSLFAELRGRPVRTTRRSASGA